MLEPRWEEDLEEVIPEDVWTEILKWVHNASVCGRHGLIECKVLYWVYYTKV